MMNYGEASDLVREGISQTQRTGGAQAENGRNGEN